MTKTSVDQVRERNVPDIGKDNRALRNEISVVHIIFRRAVWRTWNVCNAQLWQYYQISGKKIPSGVVVPHLMTSFAKALQYGKLSLSSNVGSLELPTTASSSA